MGVEIVGIIELIMCSLVIVLIAGIVGLILKSVVEIEGN